MKRSILIALLAFSSCASNQTHPCDQVEQSGFMIETLKISDEALRSKAQTEFEANNHCTLEQDQ